MSRWGPLFCLFLVAVLAFVAPASAQHISIDGLWQQVETTAGACPTCRIEVARKGGALAVVANNGWSAEVHVGAATSPIEATGTGVWSVEKLGWVSGRRFDLILRPIDRRLHMKMYVVMDDGSGRVIEAVFQRVWLGA